MAYALFVNVADSAPVETQLTDGRYRIGCNPECEICIEFQEVANVAAQLDVRGEAVFIRNLNPYPIYVGEVELSSSQQGEWPAGSRVLLTQNVSLDLVNLQVARESALAADSAKRSKSSMQLAVVALCIVASYFLLSSDSASPDSTRALSYSFTDLVEQVEKESSRRHTTVLNYMIDARISDVRWGNQDPTRAISAYQLLLDEPLIRETRAGNDTLEGRIRQFALARLDDLSAVIKKDY